jgi:hypothetical protein
LLASRGRQGESPVRPLLHVVADAGPKNAFEVTASPDEDVVEALSADRAHEPLGERVRLRGPDRGQDHLTEAGGSVTSRGSAYRHTNDA